MTQSDDRANSAGIYLAAVFRKTACLAAGVILLMLPVLPAASEGSQTGCEDMAYPVTTIGIRTTIGPFEGSFPENVDTRIVPSASISRVGNARYLRVLIEALTVGNCDWYITVRDESYHAVQTFSRSDFAVYKTRWSQRIPGKKAIISFQRCEDSSTPQIRLREIIQMPEEATNPYYSTKITGQPDWRDLYENLENAATKPSGNYRLLGDHVALVMSSAGNRSWVCSGVVIASGLLLTNWHCGGASGMAESKFWDEQIVKDTIVDLSFDDDSLSREYMAVECLIKDIENDFAVLRILPINPGDVPRPAALSSAAISNGQGLQIVHHPSGARKRISYACNVIDPRYRGWRNGQVASEFTHQCDTERGSSGAPVFDINGRLIGLHHLGFAPTKDGTCDRTNKAVTIQSILSIIRARRPEIIRQLQLVN